jgi:hypothetical protein
MTPVCPACRAPVRLDSFACGRCGLAIRPTCGQCSEPLTVGMTSCWRCSAEINEPSVEQMTERPESINVAAAAAAAAVVNPARPQAEVHRTEHFAPPEAASFETAAFEHARAPNEDPGYIRELEQTEFDQENDRTATQSMEATRGRVAQKTTVAYAPSLDPPRLRFRPGRVIFVGIVAGVLVAIGLLVAEGTWARYRYPDPSKVSLSQQQFAQFDFSVEVPSAWDVEPAGASVEFTDPGRPDERGVRVTRLDGSLEDARVNTDRSNRARFTSYRRLRSSGEERVGGRPAILREFIGNDLQYRQWVVANDGSGSFEIVSWFHPAEADETQIVDQRVIESFIVL